MLRCCLSLYLVSVYMAFCQTMSYVYVPLCSFRTRYMYMLSQYVSGYYIGSMRRKEKVFCTYNTFSYNKFSVVLVYFTSYMKTFEDTPRCLISIPHPYSHILWLSSLVYEHRLISGVRNIQIVIVAKLRAIINETESLREGRPQFITVGFIAYSSTLPSPTDLSNVNLAYILIWSMKSTSEGDTH